MLFLRVFIFLLSLPFLTDALIITEVQIEGEKPSESYIKIYNPSESNIDISSYSLRKKTSSGNDTSLRLFPKDSVIKSKDYFTWASSKESSFPKKVGADVSSVQTLSQNNSIALFDSSRVLLDALSWGEGENQYVLESSIANPVKGQIIKRKKENGFYSIKNNNSLDFSLYPPPLSPLQIKDFSTKKEEEIKVNPFSISLFSAIILATIILLLKRKCQDTVTSKT
jgi:hypothetical protein